MKISDKLVSELTEMEKTFTTPKFLSDKVCDAFHDLDVRIFTDKDPKCTTSNRDGVKTDCQVQRINHNGTITLMIIFKDPCIPIWMRFCEKSDDGGISCDRKRIDLSIADIRDCIGKDVRLDLNISAGDEKHCVIEFKDSTWS